MSLARGRLLALAISLPVAVGLALVGWRIAREKREAPALEFAEPAPEAEAAIAQAAREHRESSAHEPPSTEPGTTLGRFVLPEKQVREVFNLGKAILRQYDRWTCRWHLPHLELEFDFPEHPDGRWVKRTNSVGFRRDGEVAEQRPDLRVLVAGDSHTDGIGNNDESFTWLAEQELERRHDGLSAEWLNGGHGGFSFYEYLGTLEKFLDLEPQVFVVVIYGGNDFYEVLKLHHLYQGEIGVALKQEDRRLLIAASEKHPEVVGQVYNSVLYMTRRARERRTAMMAARTVTLEIARQCKEQGIAPVFVYLPSVIEVRGNLKTRKVGETRELLGLERDDELVLTGMGNALVAFLRKRELTVLDLRPAFLAAGEPLYWRKDLHVNLAAQRLIARELVPLVEAAAGLD